jgi:hypothetical protein
MNRLNSGAAFSAATLWRRFAAVPFGAVLLLALAACNGSAVVTLTTTPSTDTFLAYRVGLVSIQLQTSSGRTASQALPSSTTVDLTQFINLSEVLGVAGVTSANYTQAVVTLDYSSANIVYDDGSLDGVALKPLGPSGQALGLVTVTLDLDPSNDLTIVRGSAGRLSLAFNLAASNIVNLTAKTVTVTPMIAASASPLDTKVVRIRGPVSAITQATTSGATTTGSFSTGIVPFDFGTAGAGSLLITPSTVTTYEINGVPSIGAAGLTNLAALSSGAMAISFGTLTTSTDSGGTGTGTTTTTCADGSTPTTSTSGVVTCADGSTPTTTTSDADDTAVSTTGSTTSVSFAATQVLAGSSAQGSGFDRISGIVSARSGNTLTVEDGTLLSTEGTNSFIPGTATITIGPNTQVTQFGSGSAEANATAQISVGSLVYAFGTAGTLSSSGNVTLDASAGRVRLGQTTASGMVTVDGSGVLTLDLVSLGGRSASAFDFVGTGTSASDDASASAYLMSTGPLDLTNSTVGSPVQGTGLVTAFGAASPTAGDFAATTLLDYTTINAELVLDWGGGTASPFASYSSTEIVLNALNSSIGARHEIQVGPQTIDIVGIASSPLIVPNATASNTVFTIGHAVTGTYENFITYAAFIAELQTELNGTVLTTGITAIGQYTANTYTFSASSITLFLNN